MPEKDKKYLSTRQVADVTGFCPAKIRSLIEQGKLPAVNTSSGNRPLWTVRADDLEAFLTPVRQPTEVSDVGA